MGIKKRIILSLLIITISNLFSLELKRFIENNDFSSIKNIFYDDSWKKLRVLFLGSTKNIAIESKTHIVYFKHLKTHGIFGIIKFKRKNEKYGDLEIFDNLGKFYYIKSIYCLKLKNYKIEEKEFFYILKKGFLCYPEPSKNPFMFSGKGEFLITPSSPVEKHHLKFITGKEFFKIKTDAVVFWNRKFDLKNSFFELKNYKKKLKKALNLISFASEEKLFKNYRIYFPLSKKNKTAILLLKNKKIGIYNEKSSGEVSYFIPEEKRLLVDYNVKNIFSPKRKIVENKSSFKKIRFTIKSLEKNKILINEELYLKEPKKFLSLSFSQNIGIKKVSWDRGNLLFFSAGDFIFFFGTKKLSLLSIDYEVPSRYYQKSKNLYILNDKKFYFIPDKPSFFHFEVLNSSKRKLYESFYSKRSEFSIEKEDFKKLYFALFEVTLIPPLSSAEIERIKKIFIKLERFIKRENLFRLKSQNFKIYIKRSSFTHFERGERILLVSYPSHYELNKKKFEYKLLKEILKMLFYSSFILESYREDFIPEGISEYFAMKYLRETDYNLYRKTLNNAIKKTFKRWDAGPIIFGRRIGNWEKDYKNYEAIVSKKMFIVLLFGDKLFKKELSKKLVYSLLRDHLRKTVNVETFLKEARDVSEDFGEFLKLWLLNYKKPELKIERKNDKYVLSNLSELYLPLMFENKKFKVLKPKDKLCLRKKPEKIDKSFYFYLIN